MGVLAQLVQDVLDEGVNLGLAQVGGGVPVMRLPGLLHGT